MRERSDRRERFAGRVFVGRQRELEQLRAGLAAAGAGRGCLYLVVGQAGIGKTRLAEELTREAAEQGAEVLWGRCWEGEGAPPYWPWVHALRAYVRDATPEVLTSALGAGAPYVARLLPEVRDRLPDLPAAPSSIESRRRSGIAGKFFCAKFLRRAGRFFATTVPSPRSHLPEVWHRTSSSCHAYHG